MASQQPANVPHRATACLGRLSLLSSPPPRPSSYPSISSIPTTSAGRLAQAENSSSDAHDSKTSSTVLYLAYGSNLCAETFLGRRGIRPVSQVNVSAPTLQLTFDLPGTPYNEPCFANTAPRKVPRPPVPDPGHPPPKVPPLPDPPVHPPWGTAAKGWDQGLIGVVYEVTQEDYKTIIATEGGGMSYLDILVPCLSLPIRVPTPGNPELPKPFMAHTLYSPSVPDEVPDKKWWYKFVKPPHRPDPEYAQPSARYLKLIADGAKEHNLPADYQAWLGSLQPYTITSRKQKIGKALYTLFLLPLLLFFQVIMPLLSDEQGDLPKWIAVSLAVFFNLNWMSYDCIAKKLFGDGERTVEKEERWADSRTDWKSRSEKQRLMDDDSV